MSPKVTKSKNLHLYPYFFKCDDPSDIPFDELGEQHGISPNVFRGMMRAARRENTIYTALRKEGYGDDQIPWWFARPGEPLVYSRAASAEPRVSAEKRSGAEATTAPPMGDTMPVPMARKRSAERSSVLSMRSAPPANLKPYQPVYQPPMNPLLDEAYRQIRESHLEEMRASIDRGNQRRQPPNPIEVIMGQVEAFKARQYVETRNTAQMMSTIFMMNAARAPEHVDVEEIKDTFTKPFEEMRSEKERQLKETGKTISAIHDLLWKCIPQTESPYDFIHSLEAANNDNRRRERQDIIDGVKMIAEKRKTKNNDLLFLDDQTKRLWKTFRTIIEQL
jgi:hypothetical protein